jgi:hypothetical protein
MLQHKAVASNLKIREPDDAYEREFDAVADKVMRMADADVQTRTAPAAPALQRKCADCAMEDKEDEGQAVRTKTEPSGPSTPAEVGVLSAPPSVADALTSPGRALDPEARVFLRRA